MNDGTRRAAGIGLVVLGLALVVVSAVGLLTSGDDETDTATPEAAATATVAEPAEATATPVPEPSATTPPEPTATPEPTPEPTPAPTEEPTATPEAPETLDEFVAAFNQANSVGDTTFASDWLHPVVIEIFGAELCQTWLDNRFAGTTIQVTGEPSPLGSTSFGLPDGSTSEVTDYFTVAVDLTFQGSVTPAEASFAYIGPDIYWFTNCEAV